jgi:hypothetical protein
MNAVFIHIPKTGGLTIQQALQLKRYRYPHQARAFNNQGIVTFGHLDYKKLLIGGAITQDFNNSAFKFAFTRNPYDRVVSHFFYSKRKHPEVLPKDMDFEEFTANIGKYGGHFLSQKHYVDGIRVDFLARFERFEQDLETIAHHLNINIGEIPVINPSKHKPYWEYYNKSSKENVYNYYKKDFEAFEYAKDDPNLH